jgi:hypothetical protein
MKERDRLLHNLFVITSGLAKAQGAVRHYEKAQEDILSDIRKLDSAHEEKPATAGRDARIAELEGLLTECLNTNENEHMDPDLVARVNRSLMDRE